MAQSAEALEPRLVVAEAPVAVPGFPRGLLVAKRPRQWVKNLFVLAGVVFAGKVADPQALLEAAQKARKATNAWSTAWGSATFPAKTTPARTNRFLTH